MKHMRGSEHFYVYIRDIYARLIAAPNKNKGGVLSAGNIPDWGKGKSNRVFHYRNEIARERAACAAVTFPVRHLMGYLARVNRLQRQLVTIC